VDAWLSQHSLNRVAKFGEWIKLDFAVFDALATALLSASAAIDLLIENKRSLTQTRGFEIVTRKREQESPFVSQVYAQTSQIRPSNRLQDFPAEAATVRSEATPSLPPALVNELRR
jgi:hypothetical protein